MWLVDGTAACAQHTLTGCLHAAVACVQSPAVFVGVAQQPMHGSFEKSNRTTSDQGVLACPPQAGSDKPVAHVLLCACRLQPSSYSRTTGQWEQEAMALLIAGDRLAVLQLPGPSSGVVRCYVKRVSGLLGMGQHFELRLESTDECLAVARRRVKSASSSYIIGLTSSGCRSGSSTPCSDPSQHGGGRAGSSGSSGGGGSSLRRDDPEVVGKVGG